MINTARHIKFNFLEPVAQLFSNIENDEPLSHEVQEALKDLSKEQLRSLSKLACMVVIETSHRMGD